MIDNNNNNDNKNKEDIKILIEAQELMTKELQALEVEKMKIDILQTSKRTDIEFIKSFTKN